MSSNELKSLALAELQQRIESFAGFKCSIMMVRGMGEPMITEALPSL